jgi:prepilin-type N-terminal cleavage/methylation domain-containing protein
MQRRQGFTLVEMMVAMGLTVFVMVILTQAFVSGLESFRQLKGIADMQQGLRTAMLRIQNDLSADHFEAGRKLSDANFWGDGNPRLGFFVVQQNPTIINEGLDRDNLTSWRATTHRLWFSIRLRGNRRDGFLSASVPNGSPLFAVNTTLGNQPADARFQDVANTYTSAWGEVCYYLVPQGSTAEPNNPASVIGTPMFTLVRVVKVVVDDSNAINAWRDNNGNPIPATQLPAYAETSCQPDANTGQQLIFNSPVDLANGQRAIAPGTAYTSGNGAAPLLSNVISFQVAMLVKQPGGAAPTWMNGDGAQGNVFDTTGANPGYQLLGLQITLRVWDIATEQTRQVTLFQDL